MKLTNSIVAIIALSSMSFAGGDIIEPVFAQETVEVPVEPVVMQEPVYEETIPAPIATPTPIPTPIPTPKPVDVVVAPVVAKALGLYISGGLTGLAVKNANCCNTDYDLGSLTKSDILQDRQIAFTGRLGYDFMDYLGAELRATYGIAKDAGTKFKQVGAYLKPNYNITEAINLYGLIGASKTNGAGLGTNTGLSYGAGLDYAITDKVSVFTDAVNYMKKDQVPTQWGLTLGASYQF